MIALAYGTAEAVPFQSRFKLHHYLALQGIESADAQA